MHRVLLERFGGSDGLRDPGALEAALFRPQSGYYEDIIWEASALFESLSSKSSQLPTIEVTAETTQHAARRLVESESVADLVLLNFASARNAGGGFINGAKAQEEDLCRCSGLYQCLISQRGYYDANRKQESALYTDHLIYSPNVPWFRTRRWMH